MAFIDFLYGATVWQIGVVISAIVVGGTIAALFLVERLWSRELRRSHNDITGFLIAVVGVILAVLISALTIEVMTRQDRATALVAQEADTLSAIERLSIMLEPEFRAHIRKDVKTYVDAVVTKEWPEMNRGERPKAAERALSEMWDDVAKLPATNLAQLTALQQLEMRFDKLFETRRGRTEIATTGVDRVVWGVVIMGSATTILFAILFGVHNFAAHVLMTSLLSFTIALSIIMLVSIDWPYYGYDSIGPERLEELRAVLNAEHPATNQDIAAGSARLTSFTLSR